jgi:two-component system CheB/CheR fusion protein
VLIQHLAPDHKSILSELIRRYTSMHVYEVEDGMVLKPNCIYIIPPNHDMGILNGALQLFDLAIPRAQRLPIDFFFRELAVDQKENAIAIVLSGTGSDGTQGIKAIKAEGGLIMAQDPQSAEFDGMPISAIATGLVDFQLAPNEMPVRLTGYVSHPLFLRSRSLTISVLAVAPSSESTLNKIFILMRAQTGHDFSNYKTSTIHRRIERRMAVHQIDTIDIYAKFLQTNQAEVAALFHDILIGVTQFFRDEEVFKVLEEKIIPKLFEDKPAGSVIRVWCTACSTGEEAYSIAILLQERIDLLKLAYTVQVFATDIDSRAIATARAGCYPTGIAVDVTPERLQRFFTVDPDGHGYRIRKRIRDLVIFSEHDIIKDPPFSRLDLVSCRNLLIYMNIDLQKKMIPLFHYALHPGGILFLGTSEGIGEFDELFLVLDRKAKLYQRKENFQGVQRGTSGRFALPSDVSLSSQARLIARPEVPAMNQSLRELTEHALLQQLAPSSALVDAQGDLLYLYGSAGSYLQLVPGEVGVNNILKMSRDGLRPALSNALHKAKINQDIVRADGLRIVVNDAITLLNITVRPLASRSNGHLESILYLVIFEEVAEVAPDVVSGGSGVTQSMVAGADSDARITALEQELSARDEYLQATQEELESSNEELKSANEEMQSVNEELQSTNEEMETSKEELQSVNEELATVNQELQTKVLDLSRANNDMNNLLAGTGIGTVFVDHSLRILRFTPAAMQIINLIPGDIGRQVGHIVSNLVGYSQLVTDTQSVLDTLTPKEFDVQTLKSNWYTVRIQPYRTLDNVIEGAVITFADVTELKKTEAVLHKAVDDLLRLATVVRDSSDAITVQDMDGNILAWNPGAVRMYGWSEEEALKMKASERIPPELRENAMDVLTRLSHLEVIESYNTQRLNKHGAVIEVSIISTALIDQAGSTYAISTTERPKDKGAL